MGTAMQRAGRPIHWHVKLVVGDEAWSNLYRYSSILLFLAGGSAGHDGLDRGRELLNDGRAQRGDAAVLAYEEARMRCCLTTTSSPSTPTTQANPSG